MLGNSKKKEMSRKSPGLNTYKSGHLPPSRPLASLSLRNHHAQPNSPKWPLPPRPLQGKDESSNAPESNLQESLCFAGSRKWNAAEGKEKIESTCHTKRREGGGEGRGGRVRGLQGKLQEMRELVVSHEMQLLRMKSQMKEGEVYRLLKMQSIQKWKLLGRCPISSHSKSKK